MKRIENELVGISEDQTKSIIDLRNSINQENRQILDKLIGTIQEKDKILESYIKENLVLRRARSIENKKYDIAD